MLRYEYSFDVKYGEKKMDQKIYLSFMFNLFVTEFFNK